MLQSAQMGNGVESEPVPPEKELRNVNSWLFARNDVNYGIGVEQGFAQGTRWYKFVTGKVLVLIHWVHVFKPETGVFIAMKLTSCTSFNTHSVTRRQLNETVSNKGEIKIDNSNEKSDGVTMCSEPPS